MKKKLLRDRRTITEPKEEVKVVEDKPKKKKKVEE